jgi:RHS repeat-associated protein
MSFCASRYTGKERDQESGLDFFGARYYASMMGRFMSPDYSDDADTVPYADLTNPQSLNLYAYVNNNPLSLTDPDGHGCFDSDATSSTNGNGDLVVSGNCNWDDFIPTVTQQVSQFVSQVQNTVQQAASHFSNVMSTPGGPGCMAELAGTGAAAGVASGAEVGALGLAGGPTFGAMTMTGGAVVNGIGGGAAGVALAMTACPGGAANGGSQSSSGGSRGSTGRGPKNLKEQLAAEQAASNPKAGTPVNLKNGMSDSRWPGSQGWVKMAQNVNGVEVHYNYNSITGVVDDIKIK